MSREMKDSGVEWLGEIPKGWNVKKGKALYSITTGKLDANAEEPTGIYPFFTCSMFPKKINQYAFDCEALLVAGNGVVGFTQYYKGKFNAYQRTYVLSDFHNIYPLFLKYYVSNNLKREVEQSSVGFKVCYFKPESGLNQTAEALYKKNEITCNRQWFYSNDTHNSVDMVLAVNGIPVFALELKNQYTGQ